MGAAPSVPTGPVSIPVSEPAEGETAVYRHPAYPKELVAVPFPEEPAINTAIHAFQRTAARFADRNCLGLRPVLADGTRGPYEFEPYSAVAKQVRDISSALAGFGLGSQATVGIFSINRPEWTKVLLSLWMQSYVSVPLYDTLGASAVQYILGHAEVSTVFVSKDNMKRLVEALGVAGGKNAIPSVVRVIQFEDVTEEEREQFRAAGIQLLSLGEIMTAGAQAPVEPRLPSPDQLAYIMYTSGTTGDPKGVLLTHVNILSTAAGLRAAGVELNKNDVYLSFLPLAHSFETCMQVLGICAGGSVGFYQGNVKELTNDILALRPTVFAGVPRVYSRIYDRVQRAIETGPWAKRALFQSAYSAQLENIRTGQPRSGFWDSLVFEKTRERLGGRIRMMATGAAPMPAHIMEFLRIVFMCPVLQGYGLTENAAAACVTPGWLRVPGMIGGPIPCSEIKLVDVPEMNYTSKDQPEPRGEICIRGNNVFRGYYKLDKETRETLDEQGWLHTGDVGSIAADGCMKIIDRKKNIFKLAQGEYVAAEELENIFAKCNLVAQIWIYGNSFRTMLVAIVVPNPETLKPLCAAQGIEGDIPELCTNPAVIKLILDKLTETGKADRVSGFKFPKAIHLEGAINDLGQGFTVENDCLTPTFKLRRPQLLKRYQTQIDAMYASLADKEREG